MIAIGALVGGLALLMKNAEAFVTAIRPDSPARSEQSDVPRPSDGPRSSAPTSTPAGNGATVSASTTPDPPATPQIDVSAGDSDNKVAGQATAGGGSVAVGPVHGGSGGGGGSGGSVVIAVPADPARRSVATGPGKATIDQVVAADGQPGIGANAEVTVTVTEEPASDRQLFLVCERDDFANPIYYTKAQVPSEPRTHVFRVQFGSASDSSQIGTTRTCYIVSADHSASLALEDNLRHDGDTSYDKNRTWPAGSVIVSNRESVTRTR